MAMFEMSCLSRSIDALVKPHGFDGIVGKKLVLGDESESDSHPLTGYADFKNFVSGQLVDINPKFIRAYSYRYRGSFIQAINGMPRFADATESVFRRFLVLPFEKY